MSGGCDVRSFMQIMPSAISRTLEACYAATWETKDSKLGNRLVELTVCWAKEACDKFCYRMLLGC